MPAQGERRGHLTQTSEPEAQFAGGDGSAMAATTAQAQRLRARKGYLDALAARDLQEVWERRCGIPDCQLDHPASNVFFKHQLVGYRKAHTGALVSIEQELETRP